MTDHLAVRADGEYEHEVVCSCCGAYIARPVDNVSHGDVPYPHDNGHGWCHDCGGQPEVGEAVRRGEKIIAEMTEAELRKALGWMKVTFFDARIEMVAQKLNPENAAKFKACSYAKKVAIVAKLLEKGSII